MHLQIKAGAWREARGKESKILFEVWNLSFPGSKSISKALKIREWLCRGFGPHKFGVFSIEAFSVGI